MSTNQDSITIIPNEFIALNKRRIESSTSKRFNAPTNTLFRPMIISLIEKHIWQFLVINKTAHITDALKSFTKTHLSPVNTIDNCTKLRETLLEMESEKDDHNFGPIFEYYASSLVIPPEQIFCDGSRSSSSIIPMGLCFCQMMEISPLGFVDILWCFLTNIFKHKYDKYAMRHFIYLVCYCQSPKLCNYCISHLFIKTKGLKSFINLFTNNIYSYFNSKNIYCLLALVRTLNQLLLSPTIMKFICKHKYLYQKLFTFWVSLSKYYNKFKLIDYSPQKSVNMHVERILFDVKFNDHQSFDTNVFLLQKSDV
eukprot:506141_1